MLLGIIEFSRPIITAIAMTVSSFSLFAFGEGACSVCGFNPITLTFDFLQVKHWIKKLLKLSLTFALMTFQL